MYDTKYHRPDSVEDAVALLQGADDGKFISGGQTLIPTMKQRLAAPSDLVDLMHVGMSGVDINGSKVTIKAATTHAEVANHDGLRTTCAGISSLAGDIGDPQVRHRGTIGGSIANNDPAADYPAAMLALNATINTNKRAIAADDFFTGIFETALEDDEIIISVEFDAPEQSAYAKFPNPASRYAMAGVFVAKGGDDVRVGVTGAGSDGAYRQTDMEAALSSDFSSGAIESVSVSADDMLSDLHGDGTYRANLVKVMAKRAVEAAA